MSFLGTGHVLESENPGADSSAPSVVAAGPMRTMDEGTVKKIVFQKVPAQQRGHTFFVPAFFNIYHRFMTTHQVLNLLFQR